MMEIFQVKLLFWPLILLRLLGSSKGVTLLVPPSGNCGDETTLTCQYTGTLHEYRWVKVAIGAINPANDPEKYRAENDTNALKLIIKNTELSDSGSYSCSVNCVSSYERNLEFECKASTVTQHVGKDKKLILTIDRLYPIPAAFDVVTTSKQITGSDTCVASTQYPGYSRCLWTSNQCLSAGTYNYSAIVTTVTRAPPLTGLQTLVSPNPPVISNTETLGDNRVVVRAVEGQPVTLQCISRNGVPQSTLAWYRDSTSTAALKQEGNGVLTYQMTPTRQDDRVKYRCRSWYPQAETGCRDPKRVTVRLYLTLKPSLPMVVLLQNNTVTEGEQATFQCTSSGSRPAASLSWTFRGQTIARPTIPTEDNTTETFSIVSSLSQVVTRQDNGQTVGCTVTLAPFTDQTGNTNIIVRFRPKILSQDNRFNGSPGKSFNITVPFHSYPNHTSVKIKRRGTLISSDSRVTLDTAPATVTDGFHGVSVSLDGYILRLDISTLTEDDFSNYTLEIDNDIGMSVWPFFISNRSVPDMPRQVSSTGTFTTAICIWRAEFNGGYAQTFFVEVSPVGNDEWTEKASIKESDQKHLLSNGLRYVEIRDLDPGVYLSRIYSANKLGKSAYSTQKSTFTVSAVECPQCSEQQVSTRAIAGRVVVGTQALIIVVLVVVMALLYRRRKKSNNKDTEKQLKDTQKKQRSDRIQLEETRVSTHLYDYEDPSAATIVDKSGETKIAYEQLDPTMKTDGAYDAMATAKENRQVSVNSDYINLKF